MKRKGVAVPSPCWSGTHTTIFGVFDSKLLSLNVELLFVWWGHTETAK